MSTATLTSPGDSTLAGAAHPQLAHCTNAACRAPMLYAYQQTPGDGTTRRATQALCGPCYGRSWHRANVCPEPLVHGNSILEDVRMLLGAGESASAIARRVGHSSPNSTARLLRRRGEKELLRRFLSAQR